MESAFARIRARFLLPWLLAAAGLSVVVVMVVWPESFDGSDDTDPWPDAVAIAVQSGFIFAITALRARSVGLGVSDLFRDFPSGIQTLRLTTMALPLVGLTLVGVYILYAPLSLVFPDATQVWLFEDLPVLYSVGPPFPILGNLIGIVSVSIAAPIAEEWFFRGLLLRRWSHKWGTVRGVIASSLVFALLHMDILGGFAFGVVMCALYARYHSLWAPTIVHVANNALVTCLVILDAHGLGPVEPSSVAQLRAAWWLPVFGFALALPWVFQVRSAWRPISSWQFSTPPNQPLQPTSGAGTEVE